LHFRKKKRPRAKGRTPTKGGTETERERTPWSVGRSVGVYVYACGDERVGFYHKTNVRNILLPIEVFVFWLFLISIEIKRLPTLSFPDHHFCRASSLLIYE
jgi:hypothetical protein